VNSLGEQTEKVGNLNAINEMKTLKRNEKMRQEEKEKRTLEILVMVNEIITSTAPFL
jgi:hypothetical protein